MIYNSWLNFLCFLILALLTELRTFLAVDLYRDALSPNSEERRQSLLEQIDLLNFGPCPPTPPPYSPNRAFNSPRLSNHQQDVFISKRHSMPPVVSTWVCFFCTCIAFQQCIIIINTFFVKFWLPALNPRLWSVSIQLRAKFFLYRYILLCSYSRSNPPANANLKVFSCMCVKLRYPRCKVERLYVCTVF